MRLIADGVVDRDGVRGLAGRLGYSERHLHRQLVAEVGAGPIALARAQRAQTARVLIETTDLPFAQVAFGAGFASIRQFNDTVREVFATTPTELRLKASRRGADAPHEAGAATGTVRLRLPVRQPFDGDGLLAFLGPRAVPGIEEVDGGTYRRTLRLPHGPAVVELTPAPDHVRCAVRLSDLRDLASAVQRSRRLMDLDADPVAVERPLGGRRAPGPARRQVARTALARARRRRGAGRPGRPRSAGVRRGRPHPHRPARRAPSARRSRRRTAG